MRLFKPNPTKLQQRRDVAGLLARLADPDAAIQKQTDAALRQLGETRLADGFQRAIVAGDAAPLLGTGDTRLLAPLADGLRRQRFTLDDASWELLLDWLARLAQNDAAQFAELQRQGVKARADALLRVIMEPPPMISVMNPNFTEETQQGQLAAMRRHEQESLAATRRLLELAERRGLDLKREISLILDKPPAQVGWFDWKESLTYHPVAADTGYETFDFAAEKALARQWQAAHRS